MDLTTIVGYSYIISLGYIIWRLNTRHDKSSHDGIIGGSSGLEGYVFGLAAPFFASVDVVVTLVNVTIRKWREIRQTKKQVL